MVIANFLQILLLIHDNLHITECLNFVYYYLGHPREVLISSFYKGFHINYEKQRHQATSFLNSLVEKCNQIHSSTNAVYEAYSRLSTMGPQMKWGNNGKTKDRTGVRIHKQTKTQLERS